jgi:hypothetical protein
MEPTPKDTIEMQTPPYFLLENGIGQIQAGPEQQEYLEDVTAQLASGAFHVETIGRIPFGCIDGRDTRDGLYPKPDSAGGTETLFVADDLTSKRFDTDGTTLTAYSATLNFVRQASYEVGGHTDEHAHGEGSGCGANDKLPIIYGYIAQYGDSLRELAGQLGVTASDEEFAIIMNNAAGRSEFSSGRALLDALREYGDEAADLLSGEHKEVAAVINTRPGTTLDRRALRVAFGEDYEAFNVDVWTFDEAAELIAPSPEKRDAVKLAMTLYNLATAHVLCGPQMRVIIL